MAADSPEQAKLSGLIKTSLEDEHRHLADKAAEHWDDGAHPASLHALYESSLQSSLRALKRFSYREAMEFVRAAEALAHVDKLGPEKLSAGAGSIKLTRQ